jgi:peptide deformylase
MPENTEEIAPPTSDEADVEVEREHDAPPPAELDPETRARRDAALEHVRKFGDPVLRAKALPVDRFDAALEGEIERMGELMHHALGVGLAATQLGILHRVLVYRVDPEDPVTALVNPVLEWSSEELAVAEEGCLSLPGVHVEVERPAQVRVRARDAAGEQLEVHAEGLQARVIQHEIDHLEGVLILDRISREVRKQAMRAMREAQEGKTPAPAGGTGVRASAAGAGEPLQSGARPNGEEPNGSGDGLAAGEPQRAPDSDASPA